MVSNMAGGPRRRYRSRITTGGHFLPSPALMASSPILVHLKAACFGFCSLRRRVWLERAGGGGSAYSSEATREIAPRSQIVRGLKIQCSANPLPFLQGNKPQNWSISSRNFRAVCPCEVGLITKPPAQPSLNAAARAVPIFRRHNGFTGGAHFPSLRLIR